jgi:hypothetical protein
LKGLFTVEFDDSVGDSVVSGILEALVNDPIN